jgi:hypothetical protein
MTDGLSHTCFDACEKRDRLTAVSLKFDHEFYQTEAFRFGARTRPSA